jgi:hypothetical protein
MSISKKNRAPSASTPPLGSPPPVPPAAVESPADDELFWESHVAARLGLSREKISALREAHLRAGEHFVMRANAVVLTPAGLAQLEVALSCPFPATDAVPAVSTLPVPPSPATVTEQPEPHLPAPPPLTPTLTAVACRPERMRVVVVRPLGNRHLIYVRPAIDGRRDTVPPILCRVRDNAHFHPRLAPFEIIRSADGQWAYLGRLPRGLGRW